MDVVDLMHHHHHHHNKTSSSSSTTSNGDMISIMFPHQNDVVPNSHFIHSPPYTTPTFIPSNHNLLPIPNPPPPPPHLFSSSDNSPSPFLSAVDKKNSTAAIREMIFRIAAMQPINIDPDSVKPPKRRNVRISKDPQSVAARHRRERISERIRILQRLVPGGTKMDTASMLDEAIHYVKFLKKQVQSLELAGTTNNNRPPPMAFGAGFPFSPAMGFGGGGGMTMKNNGSTCQPTPANGNGHHHHHGVMLGSMQML